ncbi:hypothetical protein BC834DRAFT_989154 [Gloeopeniophorella convolvens]|nr:hypothetical protein BC834DRAFT_989154 [Gloeopeniophorella convolvens]
MSHRKRKHHPSQSNYNHRQEELAILPSTQPDPALFIIAHEADVVRGPQAARLADSLEVDLNVDGEGGSRIGDELIKWQYGIGDAAGEVWVDRYDARLLLDALPVVDTTLGTPPASRPGSPAGWSDLPSDAEDTFFLTPAETADLHRTKRLRHLDDLRTARMRALSPDPDPATANPDPWGDSDEEPDAAQVELMQRTASHVVRAANDAQLRARILAHHGADPRFAFLRGRWARAWARAQASARRAVQEEQETQSALGGLAGGNDDGDGNGGDSQLAREDAGEGLASIGGVEPEAAAALAAREARRAKLREWAEKRRAAAGSAPIAEQVDTSDHANSD